MSPQPNDAERWVVLLLRLVAVMTMSAFAAVLLPTSWMAASHARLGMGEFPASSLVDYLTRSIALLYGFHGVLAWIVSRDVRRFRPIVRYLGIMNLLFGAAMLGVDLHAGMPWFWTIAEGPPIAALGLALLWFSRRLGGD